MKHFWTSYTSTIALMFFFLAIMLWFIKPVIMSGNRQITSPLPSFLTMVQNNQVSTLSLWLPPLSTWENNKIKKPEIEAKATLVYDVTENVALFAKNEKEKLPMASLTKIVTAIIAMENQKKDNKYRVYKEDLVGEDSMGLTEGETLTLEELLYGLMLASGNDAAETLASNFILGREQFIEAMNKKVATLGLTDTNFTNPTGLEGDGNQYTTVYDLLVMTHFALWNFPLFREVVSTPFYNIEATNTHKAFYLENETNLLTSYPGVKGVKTGYTNEANLCLVTYLDYEGHQIIGILLGSNNRREEMKELLDYSLKVLGITPPPHS